MLSQREERIKSLEYLRSIGIEPYAPSEWEVNVTAEDIKKYYRINKLDFKNVSIAGRIASKRVMGGASFGEIQDWTGKIQFYIKRDEVTSPQCDNFYEKVFKKHIDIGDIVGIKGYVFTTNTGEITIGVKQMVILSKCIRPIPVIKEKGGHRWTSFTDVEKRHRMRYLDLILNPEVKERFIMRTRIIQYMRDFFNRHGYLEVETPVLQPVYGGATARPFTTFCNALDTTFYLRIANELYLKRLIVAGLPGVYEFSRNFRNEGIDRTHHPEFTMVELYVPYRDYFWMMSFAEELLSELVYHLFGQYTLTFRGNELNFTPPWRRIKFLDAIKEKTGVDVSELNDEELEKLARSRLPLPEEPMQRHQLMDELFSHLCQPEMINPTIVYDYPVELSPLATRHRKNPRLTERFEIIIGGMEIANAFSELNDPLDQKERFLTQMHYRELGDKEAMTIDLDYIRALEFGMPPTAGIGIGIDRLVMLLTDAPSIQEVILFPMMGPENLEQEARIHNIPLTDLSTETHGLLSTEQPNH